MRRLSPLLISMILLASLLAHHVHAPVAAAGMPTEPVAATHVHDGMTELQVIDHGALDEIVPELCVVGEQVAPSLSGGDGQAALLSAEIRAEALLPAPPIVSSWEAPFLPPDVLRALLQVFLN
jgi:hypothetical protein